VPALHNLYAIPSGDAGIKATLREMASIARAWKKDPRVRALATEIVAGCGVAQNWPCEAEALQLWVRDNIRFLGDVEGVETLQTPDLTLEQRAGDCDDQSILLATLLTSIGHPARFVAVDLGQGGFSHVFVETPIGAAWIAAETTEPDWELGRRPYGIKRTKVQRV
jgi:transglutaminase-like putative cysteine protease